MDETSQFSTLPPEVWNMLKARADADKDLKYMKDASTAMQAGPLLAGASEMAKIRGGTGVNLNPLLAWASGLPGAPKNLGAIAQANPYVSPSDTIAKLMGMNESAIKAKGDYLKERDKFFATQMGRPVGSAGIVKDLMKEDLIYGPRRAEARLQKIADRAEDRRNRIADINDANARRKAQRASDYVEKVEMFEQEYISPYIDPLESLTKMLDTNPNIAQFEFTNPFTGKQITLPKNLLRDFVVSEEEQAFYSELESVISQIRHEKYGSALTAQEAKNALREFGLGNITKLEVLKNKLNAYKIRMLRDLEQRQNSGSRRFGSDFDDYYEPIYNDRLRSIIRGGAPPPPRQPAKGGAGSNKPAANKKPAPTTTTTTTPSKETTAGDDQEDIDILNQAAELLNLKPKAKGN